MAEQKKPELAETLHGNLTLRATMNTNNMTWSPSPSGSVWRKRLHRVGPAESGQVTSLVRYEPDSKFPSHDHPEGEEILVLEGVFSDEHGDWPAGTYLLNPEGFHHRPFSQEGCVLFVKLRQYPGKSRRPLQIRTDQMQWQTSDITGLAVKQLYRQDGFSDHVRLERWSAAVLAQRHWPDGVEIFVLAGVMKDQDGRYVNGSWLRLPPGAVQKASTTTGCELYIKEGGFPYLRGQ